PSSEPGLRPPRWGAAGSSSVAPRGRGARSACAALGSSCLAGSGVDRESAGVPACSSASVDIARPLICPKKGVRILFYWLRYLTPCETSPNERCANFSEYLQCTGLRAG